MKVTRSWLAYLTGAAALLICWTLSGGTVPPSAGNAGLLKTTPVATNIWSATTNAARVYSISAVNVSSGDLWLFVVNTNSATVADNSPPGFAPVKISSGQNGGYDFGQKGCPFSLGCTLATSTTPASLTNSSASFIITVVYDGNPN